MDERSVLKFLATAFQLQIIISDGLQIHSGFYRNMSIGVKQQQRISSDLTKRFMDFH